MQGWLNVSLQLNVSLRVSQLSLRSRFGLGHEKCDKRRQAELRKTADSHWFINTIYMISVFHLLAPWLQGQGRCLLALEVIDLKKHKRQVEPKNGRSK